MSEWVLLKAYYHKYDAEMAVGLLKNNGIEAILQSDDAGGFRPHLTLGMGNNRVMIQERDAEKALAVIKTLSEDFSEEEQKQIEEVAVQAKEPAAQHIKRWKTNVPMVLLIVLGVAFLFSYASQGTRTKKYFAGYPDCKEVDSGTAVYGVCKEYYKNKNVRTIWNYKNGKADGRSEEFFEGGKVRLEWTYADGKLNGPYKEYFESGALKSEGNYKNDKLNGEWKDYYESGQLMRIAHFKNDELDGNQKTYYESGKLMEDLNFKDGYRFAATGKRYEGVEKTYYEGGQLWEELNYKNGKLQGIGKMYYENGNLEAESNYHKGKFNGQTKVFFKDGQIQYEIENKDNVAVYIKEYNNGGGVIFESVK